MFSHLSWMWAFQFNIFLDFPLLSLMWGFNSTFSKMFPLLSQMWAFQFNIFLNVSAFEFNVGFQFNIFLVVSAFEFNLGVSIQHFLRCFPFWVYVDVRNHTYTSLCECVKINFPQNTPYPQTAPTSHHMWIERDSEENVFCNFSLF